MKIEVGKTYKSSVAAYTRPGLEPTEHRVVPEEWAILASYFVDNQWKFVGRCVTKDGVVMVREFDEDGRDGTTKTGNSRHLLPNTKTCVDWGVINVITGQFFTNRFSGRPNTEEVAQELSAGATMTLKRDHYAVGFITYQVEE